MKSTDPKDIIMALVSIRKKRKIKQAIIAERTFTHKSNISRFENRTHSPRLRTLKKYAHAIGVELVFKIEQQLDSKKK